MFCEMARRRIAIALAAGILLACYGPAAAGASSRSVHSTGAGKHQHAPFAVGRRDFTFVDTGRPTSPNGTYPGAATRTLKTMLLYPAEGDPAAPITADAKPIHRRRGHRFPLIVFSHGFLASGPAYAPVLAWLVSRGYVVAAPTFPLSSGGAPGGPVATDYLNQPADVSFVLTRVLRLARQGHGLRRTIDRGDIGAAGHSLGGITTIGVAANSCCLDRRIDAASEWSGALLPFPGGTLFPGRTPPFLFVHGEADATLPYSGSAAGYAQAPPPKAFLTLEDAPHVFFAGPWRDPFVAVTLDFFDGFLKGNRGALRRMAADGNVPGAASLQQDLG
jgi:predicted dienelactone hydrolase